MKVAVVGHVEWATLVEVDHVPFAGEIVEAPEAWEVPVGGGAVAAVQIARLAGSCLFLTALADDDLGHRAKRELEVMGLDVEVAWRAGPQRRALVSLDAEGERTITVAGERLQPEHDDPLPWSVLAGFDAVFFSAGDADALRAARGATRLIATIRAKAAMTNAGVQLDVLVASAADEGERYSRDTLAPSPLAVVRTSGAAGGTVEMADGTTSAWAAAPLPGSKVDTFGAGDSFAGGLTFALGEGLDLDRALAVAARCGAAVVSARGPYGGQLSRPISAGGP